MLSDLEKKFLADSIFKKGLHYYIRSFERVLIILINQKHITDPFEDNL